MTQYSLKSSTVQLLCRMKDSTLLLQKRLVQERDQEQRDRDQQTLHLYKVYHTQNTTMQRSTGFCLLYKNEPRACCVFACDVGVPALAVCEAAGGFDSWSFLL